MPREKIDSVDGGGFTVQVGWSSGGSMQLGVEVDDKTSIVHQLYGDNEKLERIGKRAIEAGWPAELSPSASPDQIAQAYRAVGHEILNVVEGPLSEASGYRMDEYRGLWATLNRHGANSLIRYVRKARDSVFGRDE